MVLYHTDLRFSNESPQHFVNQHYNISDKTEIGCEHYDIVGDDICDDIANTEICSYDFGDCCSFENDRSLCVDCICNIDLNSNKTKLEKACVKNSGMILDHLVLSLLGNGKCQLDFNNEKFDFDLGDCCIEDPKCFLPAQSDQTSK